MKDLVAVRAYTCKHYDDFNGEEETFMIVDSSGNHYPFSPKFVSDVKAGDCMDGYLSYDEEELSTIDPDSIEEIEL